MKKSIFAFVLSVAVCFSMFTSVSKSQDDIMRAMQDELNRSMAELKLDKLQKPYYIEYTLKIFDAYEAVATLGSIRDDKTVRRATLTVGLRVGDYKFDNTNFFDFSISFFGSGDDEESFVNRMITIEPDYKSLRRELWLATDAAYKRNAEAMTKKETVLKNRIRKDTIPDFIQMGPEEFMGKPSPELFTADGIARTKSDFEAMKQLCKKLSAKFRAFPDVFASQCTYECTPKTVYYVNSEGRKYINSEVFAGFEVSAISQATDGMPVGNFFSAYGQDRRSLPSADSLDRAVDELIKKLLETRNANTLEDSYSGPVLFEGQAAAQLFAQSFAPCLAVQRDQLTEMGKDEPERYSEFQNKVGGRVLPEFLSVSAIPSMKEYKSMKLLGNYAIDDQGVKAEDVVLVKDGFLKNLLSGRVPTKRIKASNGHCRGGSAMLSTIELSATDEKVQTNAEMRERLIQLCRDRELPYAIVVKKVMDKNILGTAIMRLSDGDFISSLYGKPKVQIVEAVKLFADGHEEVVRGVEGLGFTPQGFKDILSVGSNSYALNYLAPSISSPYMTGGDAYVHCSVITPDLLFEDAEIKPLQDDFTKPPIIKNPLLLVK